MDTRTKKPPEADPEETSSGHGLVLFDGVCNLCDHSVHFLIDRDPRAFLKFAALQSDVARPLLEKYGVDPERLDSILYIEAGRCYDRSGAALRIARRLRWPWSWSFIFIIVPWFIRDLVYRWIARNRYRWFGKTEQCRMPTPALRARFL